MNIHAKLEKDDKNIINYIKSRRGIQNLPIIIRIDIRIFIKRHVNEDCAVH